MAYRSKHIVHQYQPAPVLALCLPLPTPPSIPPPKHKHKCKQPNLPTMAGFPSPFFHAYFGASHRKVVMEMPKYITIFLKVFTIAWDGSWLAKRVIMHIWWKRYNTANTEVMWQPFMLMASFWCLHNATTWPSRHTKKHDNNPTTWWKHT